MLDQIIPIVRQAAEIILSAQDIAAHTHDKGSPSDLVTEYDLAVENFLKEKLPPLAPGSIFFGEEEKENADPSRGWAFIVDPIDGTTNFVRGLHHSAVSVALAKDGAVEYGVVYDPYTDELFTARRGGGAFLNGQPMRVSEKPLEEGIFIMGTAIYKREYLEPTMRMAEAMFRRSCDFRRTGSAALDLCYIACGRAEAFFEYSLCPWDYAAASLMITEAGGEICTLEEKAPPITERCGLWASGKRNRSVLTELKEAGVL